ncbi:MAG: ABC transporter ATP-binding protein [Azoarcus sp.]|jgi:iron complex transport system ATP-binding protein|nr:ABC transporter ATP-binding protein [Azoarcus sp.]
MPESAPNTLCAERLTFRRGRRLVLDQVDLTFGQGEILALLGANGSGKTTLLRCLLGLLRPDGGMVRLNGEPLPRLGRGRLATMLAYVPQAHVAPFPYTVHEIVLLGRLPRHGLWRSVSAEDRRAVEEALARMEITALRARPYTELSGGERQLALIARALAQGARLIILDEPVAGLDFGHQMRLLACLRELAASGFGILKTTHHPDQALAVATRVALLADARVQADGPPAEILSPETIERLYGVKVERLSSASGQQTFVPRALSMTTKHGAMEYQP